MQEGYKAYFAHLHTIQSWKKQKIKPKISAAKKLKNSHLILAILPNLQENLKKNQVF